MSEEIPLPLATMRKIRRIKASVKHARKIRKGHKQKVPVWKKENPSAVVKMHINLNQPGALTHESVARLLVSVSDGTNGTGIAIRSWPIRSCSERSKAFLSHSGICRPQTYWVATLDPRETTEP